MYYYEVLIGSKSYRGNEPLTYSSQYRLPLGTIVRAPLRKTEAIGIVAKLSAKPAFATKPLTPLTPQLTIPHEGLQLLKWLRQYYPAGLGTTVLLFTPSSLLRQPRKQEATQTSTPRPVNRPLPPLTDEQRAVLRTIGSSPTRTFIVHGATGSGKTRVYLELTKQALQQQKSALILTPEIGLTPQLVRTLGDAFGDRVHVGHSNLTEAERRQLWLRIRSANRPLVLVGPRSMLFYPLTNIGLVVVDEAHESAYKQEQSPHYHGLRVAAKLAEIHSARLIVGSATPNVEDYYLARVKGAPILTMRQPAAGTEKAATAPVVVDMREPHHRTRHPHLSDQLLDALKTTLSNNEQALLFLNRRGTARLVLCNVCGWQALCPNCDLPLTYHGDAHSLRCHTCGHREPAPNSCPACGNVHILFKSMGTKLLAEELAKLFPKARIQRFDTDNRKAERFEAHYHEVAKGSVDILIGTQVLTKGLDLPYLSLVGIIAADSSLNFPDYTAEERTFQLLSQVLGRIGRGHRPGRSIIQTYNPDNPTIQAAVKRDWDSFFETQIKERRQFGFPPFRHLLKLTVRRASPASSQAAASKLKKELTALKLPVEIVGPSPSFYEKSHGTYQWQLVVKAKQRQHLLTVIKHLPANWSYDIDPVNLL